MRHHFVPQFLQRAWRGADGRVTTFRLDLEQISISRLAPKSTGYEDDLWSLSHDEILGMKKDAVEEHLFARIDNEAASVHECLTKRGLRELTPVQRAAWVRFIMSLRLRDPDVIQGLKLEASETLRTSLRDSPEELELQAGEGDFQTLEAWVDEKFPGMIENFGLSFIHELISDHKHGNQFFRMKWWLWDFSTVGVELLLSDRPLILTAPLADKSTIVALPIAPYKCFLGTQSSRTAAILRSQRPQTFGCSH
jgi:hypothetical protein